MSKNGAVLVFGVLVVLVLSILSSAFYMKTMNENNLSRRHVESIRALWLAEAGVAETINNLPTSGCDCTSCSSGICGSNYTYSASVTSVSLPLYDLYTITSTGTVTLPSGATITRSITADVKSGGSNPANFPFAIQTTEDLVTSGSVSINPPGSEQENAVLDFAALFGYTKSDMRSNATHLYTPADFGTPAVDEITWVDVPVGQTLNIAGGFGEPTPNGILIVSGDVHFSGNFTFNGIIYVIGKLTISGTVTGNGAVLAESTVDTKLTGNVTLTHETDKIDSALDWVGLLSKDIVSWKET